MLMLVSKLERPYDGKELVEFYNKYSCIGYMLEKDENGTILVYQEKNEEQRRREEIMMLHMTPLDFIKAIETLGITWAQIKELMQKYPDVEKELTMCQNVYRGNPLLDQMAKILDKNITSEVLDELFIQVCRSKDE